MIKEDMPIDIQLRKADATANWNCVHSFPNLQSPRSWTYRIVIPAEEDAAARDNVAVTYKWIKQKENC